MRDHRLHADGLADSTAQRIQPRMRPSSGCTSRRTGFCGAAWHYSRV